MDKTDIIILHRDDLFEASKDKSIEGIGHLDFDIYHEVVCCNSVIMFIDDTGVCKILKNRYGQAGIVN